MSEPNSPKADLDRQIAGLHHIRQFHQPPDLAPDVTASMQEITFYSASSTIREITSRGLPERPPGCLAPATVIGFGGHELDQWYGKDCPYYWIGSVDPSLLIRYSGSLGLKCGLFLLRTATPVNPIAYSAIPCWALAAHVEILNRLHPTSPR